MRPAQSDLGFSIVEALIAMVIALTTIMAVASFQANIATENRAIGQKMEVTDLSRQLAQLMSDDNLCTCNLKGLGVHPDATPGPTGLTTFSSDPLPLLRSVCPAAGAAGAAPTDAQTLARANADYPRARFPLPVARIIVSQMTTAGDHDAFGNVGYTGMLQVQFGDPPNAPVRKLIRPVQPMSVTKRIFVDPASNQIAACGTVSEFVSYGTPGNAYNYARDELVTPPSVAICPPGTIAIGGGWTVASIPGLGGQLKCGSDNRLGSVIYSKPVQTYPFAYRAWEVLMLCQPFRAWVTCLRPTFNVSTGP